MSSKQRLVLLGLAAFVVVAAVVIIGSGGSSDSTKVAGGPAEVVVRHAKPVGGVRVFTFKKGGTVDLTIQSDTADEIHFHGYDVHKDVAKGGTAHFRFPATIEGKFIVELENHGELLANVKVVP